MTATSVLTTISPSYATELLLLPQRSNRPIRKQHVDFLARQMERDDWQVTGETCVSFSGTLEGGDAVLVGGRHILMACVESGKEVDVFLAQGVSENAFLVTNSGRMTPFHEYVQEIRDVHDPVLVASTTRLVYAVHAGTASPLVANAVRPSNKEMTEFLDANPAIPLSTAFSRGMLPLLPAGANVTALSAAHYLFTRIEPNVAEDFFVLVRGNEFGELRRFYIQNSQMRPRYGKLDQYAALVKMWNSYRTGEPLHRRTAKWVQLTEEWPEPV